MILGGTEPRLNKAAKEHGSTGACVRSDESDNKRATDRLQVDPKAMDGKNGKNGKSMHRVYPICTPFTRSSGGLLEYFRESRFVSMDDSAERQEYQAVMFMESINRLLSNQPD